MRQKRGKIGQNGCEAYKIRECHFLKARMIRYKSEMITTDEKIWAVKKYLAFLTPGI